MLLNAVILAAVLTPGRQLFVDDAIIESTELTRVYHYPVKHAANPVLKPETKDEIHAPFDSTSRPNGGGLWWDSKRGIFRLWYEAGWLWQIAYAESKDGVHWTRPALDVVPGTNLLFPPEWNLHPDSWSVVPDPKGEGWWMFFREPGGDMPGWVLKSPDGIHWTKVCKTGLCGDRSTMFYDPFRSKWVYSLRSFYGHWGVIGASRARCYRECDDLVAGAQWEWKGHADTKDVREWLRPDADEPKDPLIKRDPQLYNFDAVAYESIMLGMWESHHGPENHDCEKAGLPKITDLIFAYSRDGFNFTRPDRTPAIAAERWASDKWDRGYVQSLSNLCIIMGDELWFYYGAFKGDPTRRSREHATGVPGWKPGNTPRNGMYHNGAMGIARLRRDGFAAMHAKRKETGALVTKPFTLVGKRLFVNAFAPNGKIAAEVLDAKSGGTLASFKPFTGDSTKLDMGDVTVFEGREVKLRFTVTEGDLYAFWIAPDSRGASGGYLAGGGPGYKSLKDE